MTRHLWHGVAQMRGSTPTLLISLLLAARAAVASDSHFDFEVLLDDRPIGTHRFDIQRDTDGTRQVSSAATFDVKVLGFVVYRYRHQAVERWAQGCLAQLEARTDDNGRNVLVAGDTRSDGAFELRNETSRVARDGCVISYAYWDPERLLNQRELLNPQTGDFDPVQIQPRGEETLVVRGAAVRANRYSLSNGKFVIDLWYSKSGEWLQLDSTTSSNRQLRYRLRG